MYLFLILVAKLAPLFLMIFLGFFAGRFLEVKKETIANILVYIVVPIVIFTGVLNTKLSLGNLSIPLLFFSLDTFMCLSILYLSKFVWKDATKNVMAFISGTGNMGYFGIPLGLALFGNNILGLVALASLGNNLFQSSVGYFIMANGQHTFKEALLRTLKLPILHAFFLGVILNFLGVKIGGEYSETVSNFTGAFTVLGMMLIGMGISRISRAKIDLKFLAFSFFNKFIIWPLLVLLIIVLDNHIFKLYDSDAHKMMILMSIVPLASNAVSYATLLKIDPEIVSFAILLSTLFSLFYIPLIAVTFLQ